MAWNAAACPQQFGVEMGSRECERKTNKQSIIAVILGRGTRKKEKESLIAMRKQNIISKIMLLGFLLAKNVVSVRLLNAI